MIFQYFFNMTLFYKAITMTQKLKLKGSMYGKKTLKVYDNPDIMSSIVDSYKCNINTLYFNYDKEKKSFYIYHAYDKVNKKMKIDYSGRWYSSEFIISNKNLNEKKLSFETTLKNINWEDFDTGKTTKKNVKIHIFFSQIGYDKLKKMLDAII